jgi:uncharacterized protein YbbC (DUF1343 family)
MKLGIEVLLQSEKNIRELKKKRVALVCHPASTNQKLEHSFDLLHSKIGLTCAFGPQHGVKGDKQYNMIESGDFIHPEAKIPIFSLYGKVRKPTTEMLNHFDVVLFDLQDLGCRIYTFITTLFYIMEACAESGKKIVVLDRPNPAGRSVEGFRLESGWESFVGAAPIPMRHGLTIGEIALYYKDHFRMNVDLQVIKMQGYDLLKKGEWGWPSDLPWVNPSPNAASLNMARVYSGTVMLEGTHLSEGRGTTRPLEVVGDPKIDFGQVLKRMREKVAKEKTKWLHGLLLRECHFEPTFYKFKGEMCHGFQIHAEGMNYNPVQAKPYRLIALMLKCVKELYPQYDLYRDFAYEYVDDKLAFDVINGGPKLRSWIDDSKASLNNLDVALQVDEKSWQKEFKKYWIY